MKDWLKWHKHYDTDSSLNKRLLLVQDAIRQSLPDNHIASYTILDICAGNGRDLVEVLDTYRYKNVVRGCLIELDPKLTDELLVRVQAANIPQDLKIIQADASQTYTYKNNLPADLILICGVFGNIAEDDIAKTIENLPKLCKQGTRVIWTRHLRAPDRTKMIRDVFHNNGFNELSFVTTNDNSYGVGTQMFTSSTPAIGENVTMFRFIK